MLKDKPAGKKNLNVIYRWIGGNMEEHQVTFFKPYPFKIGQKINIKEGPRSGDWEVIGLSDRKVRLKCPVSFKEFEWNRFCYFIEEQKGVEWPKP